MQGTPIKESNFQDLKYDPHIINKLPLIPHFDSYRIP